MVTAIGLSRRKRYQAVVLPLDPLGGSASCDYKTIVTDGYFPRGGFNSVYVYIAIPLTIGGNGNELFATHDPTAGIVFNDAPFGWRGRQHTHFFALGADQGSQPREITDNEIPIVPNYINIGMWICGSTDASLGTQRIDNGTSTSSITIGTGSFIFNITGEVGGAAEYYAPGTGRPVRATDTIDGYWMDGYVTSYTLGSSITLNVFNTSGSGTFNSWTFSAEFGKWLGKSYTNGGVPAGTTTHLEPIYPAAIPTAGTELPGPLGNSNNYIVALMAASQSVTAYNALNTDQKVSDYYAQLYRDISSCKRPTAFTGCQFYWYGADCNYVDWKDMIKKSVATKLTNGIRPNMIKRISLPTLVKPTASMVHPMPRTKGAIGGTQEIMLGDAARLEVSVSFNIGLIKSVDFFDNGSLIVSIPSPGPFIYTNWFPSLGTHPVTAEIKFTDATAIFFGPVNVTAWNSSSVSDPLTFITSITANRHWRSDTGTTTGGGTISAWSDRVASNVLTASTVQPTFTSSDSTLAGGAGGSGSARSSITFDGVLGSNRMVNIDSLSAPGTTPFWRFVIIKNITDVNGRVIFGHNSNDGALVQNGLGGVVARNTTAGTGITCTTGSWKAVQVYYSNTATFNSTVNPVSGDYFGVTNTLSTGTNLGNATPGATLGLAGRGTGSNATNANVAYAEFLEFLGNNPTENEKRQMSAYIYHLYPYTVLT